jgi:hypothetical protein
VDSKEEAPVAALAIHESLHSALGRLEAPCPKKTQKKNIFETENFI